ncbi:MAG: conjugative transposon protein TraK [Bacteroidetes bacterium]|nr:conjugative transposon protein TraK [Bacteroidota bacterium]MBS1973404.1 conjugative transposon protein TraK [Bacteroidota bacterium]
MFRQAKNIDSAFRYIRSFTMVIITAYSAICLYAVYSNHRATRESQQRIYILANGKALEAYSADRKDNIPVEARDHVKTFHHLFFTLDPDEKVITANITRALYLADVSAKEQYDNLKESGYYTNLITGNISQRVTIDSIFINTDSYPFYFRCVAEEKLIRTTSTVTRSLITEGFLRNVERSDNNPHGFLIERWTILENKDLKTETR